MRPSQVFFAEVDVSTAQEVTRRLGVVGLPYIGHITPKSNLEGDSKRKIPANQVMEVGSPPPQPLQYLNTLHPIPGANASSASI